MQDNCGEKCYQLPYTIYEDYKEKAQPFLWLTPKSYFLLTSLKSKLIYAAKSLGLYPTTPNRQQTRVSYGISLFDTFFKCFFQGDKNKNN